MVSRRLLLPLFLLLLVVASGQQCGHFSQDALLSRLESRVPKCLGPGASSASLSSLTEHFTGNEFDRRQPLALVVFSNSSDLLHATAGAIASSLFGASRSPHAVQSIDFQALLEVSGASNYEIKNTLRSALKTPLQACPERSLFVLDNVQALDDSTLPVLDVFLDPLNGKRAQFQEYVDGQASRVFDCTNSIFLFLYKVTATHSPLDGDEVGSVSSSNWREFLMHQWTRSKGTIEEFTPQAFVGRITDAIEVFSPEGVERDMNYVEFRRSREWMQMCDLNRYDMEDEANQTEMSADYFLSAGLTPGIVVMLSIPALLLILTRAKRWNGEITKKQRERGAIHRRGSCRNSRRKKKKSRK